MIWACPSGSGYPLQVLALPSSGCGLSTSIPHAKRKKKREDSFSKFTFFIHRILPMVSTIGTFSFRNVSRG